MSRTYYDYKRVEAILDSWLRDALRREIYNNRSLFHAGKQHFGMPKGKLKDRLLFEKTKTVTSFAGRYEEVRDTISSIVEDFELEIGVYAAYGNPGETFHIACENPLPAYGYRKDESGRIHEIPGTDLEYIVIALRKTAEQNMPVFVTVYPCTWDVAREKDPAAF